MARAPRAGSVRKVKKGSTGKGSGGQGRQALEGKGPTPKAEDREYHPAYRKKVLAERAAQKRQGGSGARSNTGGGASQRRAKSDDTELVTGRNSVVEALRAGIPATTLYIAARAEMDDRVKESLSTATHRGIPVLEVMRPELDRMAGRDVVHQGLALKVPPYEYAHPAELLDLTIRKGLTPLFVALDGVTDPRNLGAVIRSTAAFGGHGVIVPQRRSAGVNSAAWKTSAGALARTPVAMAPNLTSTLKEFKKAGVFVIGLAAGGDTELYDLDLADQPVVVVAGSEGKGLSRIVTETCDAIVSIPISGIESLNASVAASVALYEISKVRAQKKA
ncbi:23S rRNA (guanosine(2251)-2'-O)-methyltransferase RlmB [Gryllotalpicola protaetiae]|uniref:23S rRNA (Guanosine(2251)-2'-O)-methyltransferase RlmB n=1 Tax=Gryllotalpicola protaetiae TaxID=2419771 RepID=A0A387BFN8_9MICO|nr:23S rRNA (guanosine(2251)-2'-O)-methyltransferase RlmB [Gryllotalpicola protaetiae]AYG02835.1 23S rRNA (guanosine(2251)-2'-O)-methyltransferase RlmB [Gryllotalpicola protaetiae]